RVPPGCSFHTRCPIARDICKVERPALRELSPQQFAACHFAAPNPLTQ
ncbi:MAG: peptide ABC transporter substrate-binding protein, partial [Rhizobiaceae bacterium]|nr:peptide ABC transporter substrate-binding protein [Rhizobiaceae bacterium]